MIAVKPHQVLAIQVKSGSARLEHGWFNELYAVALRAGAVPIVADWPKRGMSRLSRITALHRQHSQHWPLEHFVTDECLKRESAVGAKVKPARTRALTRGPRAGIELGEPLRRGSLPNRPAE